MHKTVGHNSVLSYQDHIRLWSDELQDWLPDAIFDAHVHLNPPEVMAPFSSDRRNHPMCTFAGLTWEDYCSAWSHLFSGKRLDGLIAFPLPLQEVDLEAANEYVADLMVREPGVKGFLLSDPTDTGRTRAVFEKALRRGVRFRGVKPYFDLLGKSNYETTMPEFIPQDLLEFMDSERLIMMLHTSGLGMCDPENQRFVRDVLDSYPNVTIILAHMGRYLKVEDFLAFADSDLPGHPRLFLEMSSASRPEVYERALQERRLWDRLLFGSDLPFGLITGVEAWSEQTGPIFLTRDRYAWSMDDAEGRPTWGHDELTYSVYHAIKAFKDALDALAVDAETAASVRRKVFCENARALFSLTLRPGDGQAERKEHIV